MGASGSGKSTLALQLLALGARLVADDYVHLHAQGGQLWAECPLTTQGMIEVWGHGLIHLPAEKWVPKTPLTHAFALRRDFIPPRMPDPEWHEVEGIKLPLCTIDGLHVSAAAKVLAIVGAKVVDDGGA